MHLIALPGERARRRLHKTLMIMKFMCFFLMVALLQARAEGFSQKVTLNEQNVALEKIFTKIHKQTGYSFLYRDEWLSQTKKVSLHLSQVPLTQALDACFADQPLTYEIVEKTILVKQKPARKNQVAAVEAPAPFFIPIRGIVRDEKGTPLSGVSVVVSGRQKGTSTAADGTYTIEASVGDILEFSMVGYKTVTERVGGPKPINPTMIVAAKESEEIVIIGYGSARKGDVTGSVSSYKPTELQAATSVSVDAMLQGKVPGVNVTNSAAGPGAASSVLIRGANSLRGDNQPLYVIDNVPQASSGQFTANGAGDYQIPENPLATLNPNDIEDIQILKDASATAIYGSRGANGVILITTKKGKSGRPKITFNNNLSIANMVRGIEMLSLEQYGALKNMQTAVPSFFQVGDEMRYVFSGRTYDPADPQTYRVLQELNWQKKTYRPAVSTSHDLSISGGTDRNTYFLSANHKNVQGLVRNTSMQINNIRLNLNSELSKRLNLSLSMSGGFRKNNMMTGGDSRGGTSGSIITASLYAAPFIYPPDDPLWNSTAPGVLDLRSTPLSWITDYDDIAREKTFRGSAQLTWNMSNAFSYSLRTGGNITLQDRTRWFGLELFKGLNDKGFLTESQLNRSNFTIENLLNYKKSFGRNVNLTALAGVTYDQYKFLNSITNGVQFQNLLLRTNGMHFASVITPFQPVQSDYQLLSVLSRVNLSLFNNKYLITANFRTDGSSKFAPDNRWAYFPSLALAWRLDRESFLRGINWINQLKLRLSYGKTGNQSIDPYSTISAYSQDTYYATNNGDRVLAVNLAGLQNKNIRWETTSSYNAGADFTLFNSRLTGSVDVYYKETNDLLITRDIPASTAFSKLLLNQGSLNNKGVELNLSGDVVRKNDLNVTVSGNISFNRSKIIKLGLPEGKFGSATYVGYLGNSIGNHFGVTNIFVQGQEPGLFWGYKTAGIYQGGGDTADVKTTLNNARPRPGEIRFVDMNGDSVINSADMTIIGNPNPRFNYGFTIGATYKSFSLSAAFNGVSGNQIFNANLRYLATPSRGSANLRRDVFENVWSSNKPNNLYPSATYVLPDVAMDRYIEDGSFLRWADLTISYTLPKGLVNHLGLQNINVYTSCKNVMVITNYSGFDPEVNSFAFDGLRRGIDLNSFPNARTFIFGLNVSF